MPAKPKINASIKYQLLPPDFFSAFKKKCEVEATAHTVRLAKDLDKQARDIIENQRYNWFPLSPGYAKYKKRKGLDSRIMIATRDYLDRGIGVYRRKGLLFFGPKPGRHRKSGISYRQLSRWLEFGTWKMPARQLWRPLKSVSLARSKDLKKVYNRAVKKFVTRQLKEKQSRSRKV